MRKLEAEKLEEMLENPKTANTKTLLANISKEILNPDMAAFASSYASIDKKLQRKLRKMRNEAPAADFDM